MYVTEAIVLSAREIRDTERVYMLFSRDFGKITAFYKESRLRAFDTGSLVEAHIDRKNSTNRIKRMESILPSPKEWRTYRDIVAFLEGLSFVSREIPENAVETELFREARFLLELANDHETDLFGASVLFCLRACHILWTGLAFEKDGTSEKIFALARTNDLQSLMKIRGIGPATWNNLHIALVNILQS